MNTSNRWNWLKDLEAFQNSRDSLLSRSPTHRSERQLQLTAVAEWPPVMEITDNEKEYLIRAEFPGARNEDVKIRAQEGTLTITGQWKFETEENGQEHHGVKPVCGSVGRTLSLPDDVRPSDVSSEFKDGVLLVRLVKGQKPGP